LQWQPEETNTAHISLPRAVSGLTGHTDSSCLWLFLTTDNLILLGWRFLLASL
jgi:hypothetical protein